MSFDRFLDYKEPGADDVPVCVHCKEERYETDLYCANCEEPWTVSFEDQPVGLPRHRIEEE